MDKWTQESNLTIEILKKRPTCILKVHIVAIQCIFQLVAHDFELHDLLPDCHVWLCDVKIHFWVVDLIGQAITHHFWKVPDGRGEGIRRVSFWLKEKLLKPESVNQLLENTLMHWAVLRFVNRCGIQTQSNTDTLANTHTHLVFPYSSTGENASPHLT